MSDPDNDITWVVLPVYFAFWFYLLMVTCIFPYSRAPFWLLLFFIFFPPLFPFFFFYTLYVSLFFPVVTPAIATTEIIVVET
jgi:hypothetical protein